VGKAAKALIILLAASVLLYGVQAAYSTDLDKATETAGFFLVPFTLMLRLLLDSVWTRRLLLTVLAVVVVEALVMSFIGFGQLATRHLFWNQEVITANEFQPYFRVNSLFWDPNIFGRYLALVMVGLVACMLWARRRRTVLLAAATVAVLWAALVLTYSQSSLAALLAGLAVLAALRWNLRRAVIGATVALALALAYVVVSPNDIKFRLDSEKALDKTTSGRADLVQGGIELARRRPLWGFGSGSFVQSFREESGRDTSVAASHTEPVTIAAEQGAIGVAVYLALLAAAFAALFAGLRAPPDWRLAARAGVAAAFVAMLVHSLSYAAFLSDPLTWTLLALGIALAGARESPA
jgi:O-antigen ligase